MPSRLSLIAQTPLLLALLLASGSAFATPPGAAEYSAELNATLARALAARGKDYVPRTHHLLEGGAPRFTNRLILETSPYLLQHAHNPVDWHTWGDEAFARARREKKPVLLSIGYSTCHWCHVMERESFEDLEIAQFMNEHFIAIKVDREERPDIDAIYMNAVRSLSGRGGWPMTSVLTPDKQPFFGGTYFPPRDGARGSRKGFLTILRELSEQYAADPEAQVAKAAETTRKLQVAAARTRPGDVPGPEAIHDRARALAQSFDSEWGGFGRAPKFPRPSTYEVLLRYHRRTGDDQALAIVTRSLDAMAAGGIYDQIAGGFHRYSTDKRWLVPHFEKMLYDNAQLVVLYLQAYQITGNEEYARVARETLAYVAREMTAAGNGFYSATDADSMTPSGHEEEGYFFTWTPAELAEVLGDERAHVVGRYYGVTPRGNFEGRSILYTPSRVEQVAPTLGISAEKLRGEIAAAKPLLYAARAKRPPPARDDKILTSWNGLMISAFARGALVLGEVEWAGHAERAAAFVLANLRTREGRLMRSFMDGRARHTGYLDDYAFLSQGLLDLYESTWEPRWLEAALALQGTLDKFHWDPEGGGYFLTASDHEQLLTRDKPSYDGAEPSGNAVALLNLLRLHEFTLDAKFQQRAERTLAAFAGVLGRGSGAAPKMICALEFYLDEPREVLIVTPRSGGAEPLLDSVRRTFLPNRILTVASEGKQLSKQAGLIPSVAGKRALKGRATAYVCRRGLCELPTGDPAVLTKQLKRTADLHNGDPFPPLPVSATETKPAPWTYDKTTNKHWDPAHGHWHNGPPPDIR